MCREVFRFDCAASCSALALLVVSSFLALCAQPNSLAMHDAFALSPSPVVSDLKERVESLLLYGPSSKQPSSGSSSLS